MNRRNWIKRLAQAVIATPVAAPVVTKLLDTDHKYHQLSDHGTKLPCGCWSLEEGPCPIHSLTRCTVEGPKVRDFEELFRA